MKICCFAGHANVYDETMMDKIYLCARTLAEEENVTEFWLGNYGQFDRYAKTAIKRLKKERNIKMIAVIPYVTAEMKDVNFTKEYDEIIVADINESVPKNLRIIKCNEYMIDASDFLISGVCRTFGGAYRTLRYAQKKKLKIISIV